MQQTYKLIPVRNDQEWRMACAAPTGDSKEYLLFLHHGVTIDESSRALLMSSLQTLPPNSVAIARVFVRDKPWNVLNHGYWQSDSDLLWRPIYLSDSCQEVSEPLIEDAHNTALGAVLMTRQIAQKIGYLDPRFCTHLADVDWQLRAKRHDVKTVLVRNARAYADPATYLTGLGDRYSVIRDDLLLQRKHNSLGLFYPARLLHSLVWNIWRPFDFYLSRERGIDPLRRLVWAFSNYQTGLRKRIKSVDSLATLFAIRDFLFSRYDRTDA